MDRRVGPISSGCGFAINILIRVYATMELPNSRFPLRRYYQPDGICFGAGRDFRMGLLAPHQVRVYLCSADLVFSDLAESATQVACPDLISSADDVMGKHLPSRTHQTISESMPTRVFRSHDTFACPARPLPSDLGTARSQVARHYHSWDTQAESMFLPCGPGTSSCEQRVRPLS